MPAYSEESRTRSATSAGIIIHPRMRFEIGFLVLFEQTEPIIYQFQGKKRNRKSVLICFEGARSPISGLILGCLRLSVTQTVLRPEYTACIIDAQGAF